MSLSAAVDLAGYVVGFGLLAFTVVYTLAVKRERLLLPWPFALYGLVLLAQTVVQPESQAFRLLSFLLVLTGLMCASAIKLGPRVETTLVAVSSLFGVAIIIDAVLYGGGRATTLQPNMVAGLTLLLPMTLQVMPAALIATGSRGAIVGLLLATLVVTWRYLGLRWRVLFVAACAVAMFGLALLRPETVNARVLHWQEAVRLASLRPWFGWGPGSYAAVSAIPNQTHADSAVLSLLAEQGLLGVLALAPLARQLFHRWKHLPTTELRLYSLPLLALAFQNCVDDTWAWPWVSLALGIQLALLYSYGEVTHGEVVGTDGGMGDVLDDTPADCLDAGDMAGGIPAGQA